MADFPAVIELSSLDGTTGTQFPGLAVNDQAGYSVSNAGDINGDGIDDFLIGAAEAAGQQGAVYVVFGTASGFGVNFSFAGLGGTNGFRISGGEYGTDFLGFSVSAAGDVNDDGIDDLIIGAPSADPDGLASGAAYVLFGKNTAIDGAFAADIATSSLTGATGFQISGTLDGNRLGISVAGGGDFNGDGIDDIIVGADDADNFGAAYVIFGDGDGFAGELNVENLDGANGFKLLGTGALAYTGRSVANAGDVNGDGIDDMIVGAQGANGSGVAYVVFGRNTPFAATVALSGLDGATGFRIVGEAGGDLVGESISGAGDINDDGFDDLIIGARGVGATNAGAVYVVFGTDAAFSPDLNLSTLDGTNGFQIDAEALGDGLGSRVSGLGDVNGDGIDDIGFGARGQDPNGGSSGAVYVVFGRASAFTATLSLAGLDGTNGAQINGEAGGDFTDRIAGRGDFNNDGGIDILVGAPVNDAGGAASGSAWIVYGIPAGPTTPVGTPGNDDLDGGAAGETIDGGDGYDIIDGNGGEDTLSGGNNNDLLSGGADDDILNGDAGGDTLNGDAGDDQLRGGTGADKLYGGGDQDILSGDADNDYLYGGDQNDALAGGDGNDYLDGGTGTDGMVGGLLNDVYIVDSTSDVVFEAADEGYDIIRSTVSIAALAANVEGLQLQGLGNLNGTGNGLANNIQGNGGNNTLNGGAGVDTINGGDGDDRIVGGTGNDLLRGGTGLDTFVVAHAFSGAIETDIVYDYSSGESDIIDLSGIDANGAGPGDTAFTVVGAFSKVAGQMVVVVEGGNTVIKLDTTGDGKVDYQMKISGDVTGDVGDWIL